MESSLEKKKDDLEYKEKKTLDYHDVISLITVVVIVFKGGTHRAQNYVWLVVVVTTTTTKE